MALKAHLEPYTEGPSDDSGTGQRRQPRRALRLETSGTVPGGFEANVTIHNLSAAGMLLETEVALAQGDMLAIDLPEIGSVDARIVWESGHLYGCAFEQALSRAALAAAHLRGESGQSLDEDAPTVPYVPARQSALDEGFGQRLNRLRRERGLTLAQVAGELGVSKPTVWAWEKGKAKPLPERIASIADALGVSREDLDEAGHQDAGAAVVQDCRARIATAYGISPRNIRIMIDL
jgi:transcriptional regulator with XRE-family HTH domain